MGLVFCVSAVELRRALKDIEAVENKGSDHYLAVFAIERNNGPNITDMVIAYAGLVDRDRGSL